MGRKNSRLARFADLDRPFHFLQKIRRDARPRRAALAATPCIAPLSGTAAIRSVTPPAPQKLQHKDKNPYTIARPSAVRFRQTGPKNKGLAGFSYLDGARPCFAENLPERTFRSDSGRGAWAAPCSASGAAPYRCRVFATPTAAADRRRGDRRSGSAVGIGRKDRPRGAPGTFRALAGVDIGDKKRNVKEKRSR